MNKFSIGVFIVLASLHSAVAETVVSINPDVEEHAISPMAMGAGLVYSWHTDEVFADGEVAHIIKDIGIGALRWPGGTVVTFYHWDNLNGQGWMDNWNPNYDHSLDQPASNYMELDEYLDLIDETGAEIMLGVNMSSGKEWDREVDGIEEARQLMIYCKSRDYDVRYVYFDNENFQEGNNYNRDDNKDGESWDPSSYAHSLNLYAAAVKESFPDAKLIANTRNNVTGGAFRSDMQTMLSIAGDNIDLVDVHYYWQWATATWDIWKSQKPMKRNGSQTYTATVEYANNLFADEGYPHVRTAILEWNIAPGPWETDPAHNNFKTALMQSEMQMQFLQAGLDIGMLWAFDVASVDPVSDRHVIHNNDPNATALWMWLFSKAGGKTVVQSGSSQSGIYVVALEGVEREVLVYLLNKNDTDETVSLDLPTYTLSDVSEAWRFHDGGKGEGALQIIALWESGGNLRTTLQANSLNLISFASPIESNSTISAMEARFVQSVSLGVLAAWDSSAGAPERVVSGVEAYLGGNYKGVDTTGGSTDGTFGDSLDGSDTASTSFSVHMHENQNSISLQVVNRSGTSIQLDMIHFDYAPWWNSSPKDVSLVYAGGDLADIPSGTVLNSATGLASLGMNKGNYYDFDWSLADLSDRVLTHNEAAVFNLIASNAAPDGNWAAGAFDNIAITGGSVRGNGDTTILSWRAETGRQYSIMKSSNLHPDEWHAASETLVGQPGDMSVKIELENYPVFLRLKTE